MANTVEVEYDRLRRGIQQDCNALLKNVNPTLDWLDIAIYTIGTLGTLGVVPLYEAIAERMERGEVAHWRRIRARRLKISLEGSGSKEKVSVLSYEGGNPRSVVTDIHRSKKQLEFLRLVGDDVWHYRRNGGVRGVYNKFTAGPEVLKEYRAIVESAAEESTKRLQ